MSPIPTEAIPLKEWEEQQKGIFRPKVKPVPRPEPELPEIENRLEFDKIPDLTKVKRIIAVSQAERIKNKDGMNFIFYKIELELEDSTILRGRMIEGDAIKIRKLPWVRDASDSRIVNVIQ